MPLPQPVEREPIHTRRVRVDGFRRADGLWEFDATLLDTKHYEFENRFRGRLAVGDPIHDMALRLTLDDDLTIRAVAVDMAAHPYPDCPGAPPAYQALVGLRIGSGWMAEVRRRVGVTARCTHLFELLRPLATAVFQTILPLRQGRREEGGARPPLIDSCRGWRRDGEAVRAFHPEWHEPGDR